MNSTTETFVAGAFAILLVATLLVALGYAFGADGALKDEAARRCAPDRLLIRDGDSAVCAQADGGVVRR